MNTVTRVTDESEVIPVLLGDGILQKLRSLGMNAQANRREIARIVMGAETRWKRLPKDARGSRRKLYDDIAREIQDVKARTVQQWAWLEREFGDFLDEYPDLCTYTWLRDVVKREAVSRGVDSSVVLKERLDESTNYDGRLIPLDVFAAQRRNGKVDQPPIRAALLRAVKNLNTAGDKATKALPDGKVTVRQQRAIARLSRQIEILAEGMTE